MAFASAHSHQNGAMSKKKKTKKMQYSKLAHVAGCVPGCLPVCLRANQAASHGSQCYSPGRSAGGDGGGSPAGLHPGPPGGRACLQSPQAAGHQLACRRNSEQQQVALAKLHAHNPLPQTNTHLSAGVTFLYITVTNGQLGARVHCGLDCVPILSHWKLCRYPPPT